jgi:HSP20 family protein
MYATPDSVVIKAALPGIRPEDVDITITGNSVTIKGEVKAEEEVKERDYILREHRFGSFSRTVTLPEGVDTDKAEASYENGILTITLPKREEVKPKSLKVKVSPTIEGRKKR